MTRIYLDKAPGLRHSEHPAMSAVRIQLEREIEERSGLPSRALLEAIANLSRADYKLQGVMQSHLEIREEGLFSANLLYALKDLVTITETDHRWAETLLSWVIDSRDKLAQPAEILLSADVNRAIDRCHFEHKEQRAWNLVAQKFLRDVSPGTYMVSWEMEHGHRPLSELTREQDDAEAEVMDGEHFDRYRARRVGTWIAEQVDAASALPPPSGSSTIPAAPSGFPTRPALLAAASTSPVAELSAAPLKKRRRGSGSDGDETDGNKADNSRQEGGERQKKKMRTA